MPNLMSFPDESKSSTTISVSREKRIAYLLKRSYLERNLAPPDTTGAKQLVESWLRCLEPIPDDELETCYQVAMERHDRRHPFQPAEIIRVFEEKRRARKLSGVDKPQRNTTPVPDLPDHWDKYCANPHCYMGVLIIEGFPYCECTKQGENSGESDDNT
ncbi:MAG: hypothetical protein AB1489_29315 [Acidobacteriota bacterium]